MVDIIIGELINNDEDGTRITELKDGNQESSIRLHNDDFQSLIYFTWEAFKKQGLIDNKGPVKLTPKRLKFLQSLGSNPLNFWLKTWAEKAVEKYGDAACIEIGW